MSSLPSSRVGIFVVSSLLLLLVLWQSPQLTASVESSDLLVFLASGGGASAPSTTPAAKLEQSAAESAEESEDAASTVDADDDDDDGVGSGSEAGSAAEASRAPATPAAASLPSSGVSAIGSSLAAPSPLETASSTISAAGTPPPTVAASSTSQVSSSSAPTPAGSAGGGSSSSGGSCGVVAALEGHVDCAAGPPWFHASNCAARVFSRDDAVSCLNGRQLYILGNSVARQYMYELGHTLNGFSEGRTYEWGTYFDAVNDRVSQKRDCAKAPNPDQDSHAQSCQVDYAPVTSVHYMWRQWYREPFAYADTAAEGDFCYTQDPAECLGTFLAGAKPGDVLIVQLGLAYARYLKAERTDITPYVQGEAAWFIDFVRTNFTGSAVIAINTSPMQDLGTGGWPPNTNARAVTVNQAVTPLYQAAGWPVIDQFTMNLGHQDEMYSDPAHFPTEPGKCLSQAMWQHTLSVLCPAALGSPAPDVPMPSPSPAVGEKPRARRAAAGSWWSWLSGGSRSSRRRGRSSAGGVGTGEKR